MTDIVERLRSDTPNMTEGHAAMHEAAAEITRLRAKVAKADALAEALEKFLANTDSNLERHFHGLQALAAYREGSE